MSKFRDIDSDIETHEGAINPRPRRTRLMLIGIDQYQHWTSLDYPVSDCQGFFRVLQEHYGFTEQDLIHTHQRPLFDEEATVEMVFDELYRLSDTDENGEPIICTDENLIIYFAGHGYLNEIVDEGYWIPIDAPALVKNQIGKLVPARPSDLKKFISVSEVAKNLSSIKAHHIVLIVDACFPQTFARMPVDVPPGGDPNDPEEKPSRWVLTSGRLQEVADRSPFAEALRDLLESNDKPKVSVVKLGADVMDRLSDSDRQNAWSGSLTENRYDGGEFFFYRHSPLPTAAQALRPAFTGYALAERMQHGSQQYLNRLKTGRFKYLRIEKLLLTETNLPDFVDTPVKVLEELTPMHKAVASLWGQEQPHAVVLGEGGMGKTVSLLRLWEDQLDESAVPVFVALNEYNAAPESEKHDFVLGSIARNCGLAESLTGEWKNALWDFIRQPQPGGAPAILLLLDGFNEVTAERTPLLIELNRIAQEARGVQLVVSSRYVEIRNFQWAQQSEIVELQPLPEAAITAYLSALDLSLPDDEAIRRLLGNPMMLTIYAGSSEIARRHTHDSRFRFLHSQSVGELLWNFTEAQLVKYYADNAHDPGEQAWHRFLLQCLLPYIAYRMEVRGDFFIAYGRRGNPEFNFKSLLEEAFVALNHPELTEVFPEFEGSRHLLGLGEAPDLDVAEQRARRVREYLVDKLHLLVLEKEELRFLHQNFRDFFAACHLLNLIEFGTPEQAWTQRALPVYLRRLLGEIEGEHHYAPQKVLKGKLMPGFQTDSRLALLLNRYRGSFHDQDAQMAVMNGVRTLAEGRKTLAGADLRELDLQKVYLNNIPLSAYCGYYRYLPAQLEGTLLKGKQLVARGHSGSINSICYSPDGKKILSGSMDDTVKEWSVETGQCIQTLQGHSSFVNSVCYSPDGKKILSGSEDHTVKEWSVETGKCLQTLQGHSHNVTNICYSPDGKKILSGANDHAVKEWSVETGECLQTLKGHYGSVKSICYSPDGKKILSGAGDQTIKEWSAETGECMQTLQWYCWSVNSVCYSPDGKKILSGSYDKTIKEWSVETGECLQTIAGHSLYVTSVCYSPDGKKILSGSYDDTVKEWSVETGECLQTLKEHYGSVDTICYSPDGKKILSGSWDKMVKEWSVETGECLQTLEGHSEGVTSACYSPDGKKILSGSYDDTIKEWSVETGICLESLKGYSKWVTSVCYSPDGKKILSGSMDNTVKEWSVETGQCLQTLQGHSSFVNSVCYSPDGKKILSGATDQTIKEWLVKTGKCMQTLKGHSWRVNSVCYSPDGKKILSGSMDQTIKEWSVDTRECLQNLQGHSSSITCVCYSPDGKKILSGSYDNTAKEWLVETGECLQTLKGHSVWVNSICCSPDGKKILSGSEDNIVKEWSVETGACVQILKEHCQGVTSVCYSPDGKKILSGSYDNTTKEWAVETGECLQTLFNETGLFVQGLDLSQLHPDSVITEEEKGKLRAYGAIFNEEDRRIWEETIAEARKTIESTSE
jgi:WD40 repeat protein